jgi:hypothetical protein
MEHDAESRLRHLCAQNGIALPKIIKTVVDIRTVTMQVAMHALRPHHLQALGMASASDMVAFGVTSEQLVHRSDWCTDAILVWGRRETLKAVLRSAEDALWLAGSEAAQTLGADASSLLKACAGRPVEGVAVLLTLREQWFKRRDSFRLMPLAHFLVNTETRDIATLGLSRDQLLQIVPETELRDAYGMEADTLLAGL